jgi:hypothetical protein
MVPICHFLADLKVFSYILCLIILICVELKFITHARIELMVVKVVCGWVIIGFSGKLNNNENTG